MSDANKEVVGLEQTKELTSLTKLEYQKYSFQIFIIL